MARPTKWVVSPEFPEGKAVELTDEELVAVYSDKASPPYQPTLNEQLEAAFLQLIPPHVGQPYLTPAVISAIMSTKVSISDANEIDSTGAFAKACLLSLSLPAEMEADRQSLLGMFPAQ